MNSRMKWTKTIFFILIAALSAYTSASFFVETFHLGRGLLSDTLTTLINALVGLLICDVAAITWTQIYLRAADNDDLRTAAQIGAGAGIIATVTTTFGYLLITTDLLAADAGLRTAATWLLIVAIILHFLLVIVSMYSETEARTTNQITAAVAEGNEQMLVAFQAEYKALARPLGADAAKERARAEAERIFGAERVQRITPLVAAHSLNGTQPARFRAEEDHA